MLMKIRNREREREAARLDYDEGHQAGLPYCYSVGHSSWVTHEPVPNVANP
jgi:hypothetical protein